MFAAPAVENREGGCGGGGGQDKVLPFFLFFSCPPFLFPVPSTSLPPFLPPFLKVGAAFCHRHEWKKRVEGGTEKKKRGGGGQVSQGARGQLIVSGNVFHLHVYTVNSGRGLSTTPFTRCHSHTGWQFSQSKTPSTPDGFLFPISLW